MQPTTSTTSPHGRRPLRLTIAAILGALMLGACTADLRSAPWNLELPSPDTISELHAATDCDTLVQAARPSLEGAIEATWSPSSPTLTDDMATDDMATDDMATADRSAESSAGAGERFDSSSSPLTTMAPSSDQPAAQSGDTGAGPTVIGTNNQEQGVQESDLVATDGRRLVTVVNGMLRVVALDGSPTIDGTLDLSARGATQMFLHDDTLLVLGTTYGGVPEPAPATTLAPPMSDRPMVDRQMGGGAIAAPAPFSSTTSLTLVSIAEPAAPVVTGAAEVEGSLVTARRLGERARVVVQGAPVGMEEMYRSFTEDDARAVVRELDADDLLPRVARDGEVQPIGGCDDVLLMDTAPAQGDEWSAPTLSTVTVLTVGDDLSDLRPVSIQGSAETVYASAESLFIASAGWDQAGSRTDVHRFSLAGDGPATYTGSGRAPGRLLNQFSLSERGGALRLVTTLDGGQSSARLTVLDTDGTLDEIGRLDGMGIGEQVESVRFMDDVAYVVTFRQTDPLYAVSLSDPRNPALLGHLKIPGFSEYLHPIGDGLLVGVGRQVDPNSMIDGGLKISLFDVRDPATMTELDQIVVPGAWSEVGSDHLAFTWDPGRSQAVIPVEFTGCGPSGDCTGTPSGAALVVHADRSGLAEVGRFSHEPAAGWQLQPTRSVVVGDDLWTVSIGAIGRTDANRPTSVELLRF